ncbi:hypothetical protein SLEP1_g16222 [Rubroshorea leprosula]|uniref:Homer protein n=1 Tax=Rubroshorea leprosula TaxID=152421 RepID=A0AAV5J0M4_9ROSI|nr:hypothetical protein SLEP1_g16222 [Rubroshorea leprosula]
MSTTVTSVLHISVNPKFLFTESFCISSPACLKPFYYRGRTSKPLHLVVKCSGNSGQGATGDSLNDALSGMVDEQVEELLNREENRGLLDGLEQASLRVEKARRELAEIEKQQLEAKLLRDYVNQLEARAAEIAECQQEISEAREMVEAAGRSLLLDAEGAGGKEAFIENGSGEIDKDKERWESVKAAFISAVIGTLASLPISFTQVTNSTELILPIAITSISCALFGVTFRYTVRRDLDNIQLKTGTSAAFGVVKGLATLGGGPPLELNPASIFSHAFDGALYVSQNLFIFIFAAVGLDFCFKTRLLSSFPMKKIISRD